MNENTDKSKVIYGPILPKRSKEVGKEPTNADLIEGELAANIAKGTETLYTKNASGEIVDLMKPKHNKFWFSKHD